jgi:hypothetical protein
MPTAVNGQLYYTQDEVQSGLPQYHAALRQATGYTGQFSADPTQKFQQYITGATSEQQAAARRLADIYGSGSFGPGPTTRGLMTDQELPGQGPIRVVQPKIQVVQPNPLSQLPTGRRAGYARRILPIRSGARASDRPRAGYRLGPPARVLPDLAGARASDRQRPQLGREPRQKPMDRAAD